MNINIENLVLWCRCNMTEIPVITISVFPNHIYRIIVIHQDENTAPAPSFPKDLEYVDFLRFSESEIMTSIIRDGGKAISRIFNNPITIKDDLHIMPVIMDYIHRIQECDYSCVGGELTLQFYDVYNAYSFFKETLLPFLTLTKSHLNEAEAFSISGVTVKGHLCVYVCWDYICNNFSYKDFLRHLAHTIPEINLHQINIRYNPIPEKHIMQIKKWSTYRFLKKLSTNGDEDNLIREVFFQYTTLAKYVFSVPDFFSRNQIVMDIMIGYSMSSISNCILPNSLREEAKAKIRSEYNIIMRNNIGAILPMIEDACSSWDSQDNTIPEVVVTELITKYKKRGVRYICELYHCIFSTSLIHSFHTGFIPYCINELLPTIVRL